MAENVQYYDDDNDEPAGQMPFLEDLPSAEASTSFPTGRFQVYVISIIMMLVFIYDFSGSLTNASTLRIYESITCHNYYKLTDPSRIGDGRAVDEQHCKVDAVQEELAVLLGWESFFNTLPGDPPILLFS